MNIVRSSYSLESIRLKKVSYDSLTDLQAAEFDQDPGRVSFSRTIGRDILEEGDIRYSITLRVELYQKNTDASFLTVEMEGIFLAHAEMPEDLADRVTNVQAPAILFPYIRQFVSTITLNSNMNPLTLPLINLGAAFQNDASE